MKTHVLYHASPHPDIALLIPQRRDTPGLQPNSPPAVYASDHPAYAAAHGFRWASAEGFELFFFRSTPVLVVPRFHRQRLFNRVYLYEVAPGCFEQLTNVGPAGHNFCAFVDVAPISVREFESVAAAVEILGGAIVLT
jgi:hypothetical protein